MQRYKLFLKNMLTQKNINKQSAQQKTPGAIVRPAFLLNETLLP